MIAATGSSGDPGSFDALVAARNAMALDTLLSWRLTSEFRKQWQLETRELIKITADTKRADLPGSSLGPVGQLSIRVTGLPGRRAIGGVIGWRVCGRRGPGAIRWSWS